MTSSAAGVVDERTAALAPLEREVMLAWWEANTDANPQTEQRRIALEQQLSDVYADPQAYAALCAAAGSSNELLARSVEVLRLSHAAEQLPSEPRAEMVRLQAECDTVYATFRGEVGGRRWTDNDIETALAESNDGAERQAAWEASKQVGAEVAGKVRRLVEVRNECAHTLGHSNYYEMALKFGELSEARLFSLLDELDRLTAAPYREMKAALDTRLAGRFGVDPNDLMPWHYADPFFQEAPAEAAVDLDPLVGHIDATAVTLATYDSLGMDLMPVVTRSDLHTRDGKNQHAFCLCVDRAQDVRVLANVMPNERWVSTMLHEFGHAAYDVFIDPALPWSLRQPAHSLTTEAVAQLYGRLSKDPAWLSEIGGVDPAHAADLAGGVRDALRAHMLIFARWVLVMCHFERALYADPALDPDAFWWECVARYQGLRRPPGRAGLPDWAAKLHLALAPVYYQNYVLGECLASQLSETVRNRGGRLFGDPATGTWLRQAVFAPGARLRWDRLVEQATGQPLSAAAFAAEFVG